MRQHLAAAFAAVVLLSPAGTAGQPAAPPCAPRPDIVRTLALDYGEVLLIQAPMDDGRLLELYVAGDGRSWTAVAITPASNVGCLIASGTALEIARPGRNG